MKLSRAEIQELITRYQSELRKLAYQSEKIENTIKDLRSEATTAESGGTAAATTTKRRRGRPRKSTSAAPKKRRGRPPKKKSETAPKKRRGRPPKVKTDTPAAPKKRRGRPAKSKSAAPKKRRGRPPKSKSTATKKRRGRPPKSKSTAAKKTTGKSSAKGYRLSEWDNHILDTLEKQQKVLVFSDFLEAAKGKQGSGKGKLSEKEIYRRINQSLHKLANKREAIIKVSHPGRGYAYGLPAWRSGRGVKKQYRK